METSEKSRLPEFPTAESPSGPLDGTIEAVRNPH